MIASLRLNRVNNFDNLLNAYSIYEKKLVADFNAQTTNHYLNSFLYQDELSTRVIKENMCFKNVSNSS